MSRPFLLVFSPFFRCYLRLDARNPESGTRRQGVGCLTAQNGRQKSGRSKLVLAVAGTIPARPPRTPSATRYSPSPAGPTRSRWSTTSRRSAWSSWCRRTPTRWGRPRTTTRRRSRSTTSPPTATVSPPPPSAPASPMTSFSPPPVGRKRCHTPLRSFAVAGAVAPSYAGGFTYDLFQPAARPRHVLLPAEFR